MDYKIVGTNTNNKEKLVIICDHRGACVVPAKELTKICKSYPKAGRKNYEEIN